MPTPFETVRQGYDVIGERYRDRSHLNPIRLERVAALLSLLPRPGSLVLELGCGPGEPATRLLSEQHRVVGVDASEAQLRLAQRSAPAALLVQADMTNFAVRDGSVDAVASFYALGHVQAAQHPQMFLAIARWLRPGGIFLTSAPLLQGDNQVDDWFGVSMFFGGIGEAATKAAVTEAGLQVEDWRVIAEDEGGGNTVRFLWMTARKN